MNTVNLPRAFIERLPDILGPQLSRQVERTFVPRPLSIRVNTLLISADEVIERLSQDGIVFRRQAWSPHAFLLPKTTQREIRKHALYLNGSMYLQSLASQLPVLVLNPQPGERVLDMTAAPGSKTSQIAALMRTQGELIAVEKNGIRYQRLLHNLKLLGVLRGTFCEAIQADASRSSVWERWRGRFDRVLLDAPCSGEARFITKDQASFRHWRLEEVARCAREQADLLAVAWECLRPGGTLVYSTCTLSPEENELQLQALLERYGKSVSLQAWNLPNIRCSAGLTLWGAQRLSEKVAQARRILPTPEIEGFFIARLIKK